MSEAASIEMVRRKTFFADCPRLFPVLLAMCSCAATAQSGGTYRIAGTVVNSVGGHALSRARVVVRDVKNSGKFETIVTGENGSFAFSGVPAGKYSLSGDRRGFISAGYDQHDEYATAIVTGAGFDTENLTLKLAPDAVISGRVLDEFGEAVRNAMVTFYFTDHSGGVDRVRQFNNVQADDRGAYEMTPLQPGTYFVSATAHPWYAVHPNSQQDSGEVATTEIDPSLNVAYPVTFYADATEAESATPIPVRGGDHLQVDIHLNPVPALNIIFRVPEDTTRGFSIPQLERSTFDGTSYVQGAGVQQVKPGFMEITGVPAGRYDIRMSGEAGGAVRMSGIELTRDGQEVETATAESASTLKIAVHIPGETALPASLLVGARPAGRVVTWQTVDAKGNAQFEENPGTIEFLVQAPGKRYSVSHLSAEGAQVSGHFVTVASGASALVSLTLAAGVTEVEGVAKKSGKGFAGAMIVLVPTDPAANHDLFRRDQSDLDGTFVLHSVIPGSYTLLAIENGWDLDWSQPNVIRPYLKLGKAVEVGNKSAALLNTGKAIEAQSK